jgi:hypothetical protein
MNFLIDLPSAPSSSLNADIARHKDAERQEAHEIDCDQDFRASDFESVCGGAFFISFFSCGFPVGFLLQKPHRKYGFKFRLL